ncbi:MAG TPA: ABC transporter permease [Vicinamibacterales bacterium]|nr:ABC transporter permease [Vicinamibacterales bacterium]
MRNWRAEISAALAKAGHDPDHDVLEELAQHAQAVYDAARADGASPADAATAVERQVAVWAGDAGALERRRRRIAPALPPPAASSSWIAGLAQDVRYSARLFRRQASFSLLVVGTMAAGIAATTLLFSVTYGVLMKPLPWPDADRLVRLKETRGGNPPRFNSFSNAAYLAWQTEPTSIDTIAAWSPRMFTLTGAGDPERIRAIAATASLFTALGARPIIGTVFDVQDETPQGSVVVLSEGLWRQRFGADPAALGRLVQLDGQLYRIIGVLPDAAGYPDRETRVWVPLRVAPTTGNFLSMFEAVARLRPGVTAAQAAAEGTARGLAAPAAPDMEMVVRAIFGEGGAIQVSATPLRDALTAEVRRPLLVLLAAVGLLFAAATANVASLQLARATTRGREMAIRSALGAGGARVTRQLLIENLFLGLAGGVTGLAAAALLHRVLPAVLPPDFPRLAHLALDLPVAVFALAISIASGIAFGLLPARRARRLNLVESLSEDGMASVGAGRRSRTAQARALIMAGQVAIACVLLIGASLLGRSFLALLSADRGFDPSNVLTARLQLPRFAYSDERRAELVEALTARLRAVPGVQAVTYTDGPPLGIYGGTAFMLDSRQVQAASHTISPGYFAAMGIRIVDGRDFTDEDVATSRPVFIVNRAFARRYLSAEPVGQRVRGWVRKGRGHWEVIGVVDDVRHRGMTEPPELEVYLYREGGVRRVSAAPTFIVRTSGDPVALAPTLRALVRQQDASVVVDSVSTMEDRVMTSLARPRLYAILLGGFAGFAVMIAAVGLLGTLSYTVAQRSRELAVRAALGARPADLIRLVITQGLGVSAVGVAVGLAAGLLMGRAIATLLYDVRPSDALTFALVPVALLLVTIVASFVPALRASRIDPLRVLRTG